MNYRLLIEVIEFLGTLSRREQRLLRNRFAAIRNDPQKFSDYTEPDHTDRRVDIHICGKYAVKFWQDHADRRIKILNLHLADHARR
ncbi:MAG TPA: hypothetical protein VNN22_01945 [Verrucomicrobiae bacterium]|nr:hypothetical protein [Verrucomicrobiae bacterium]